MSSKELIRDYAYKQLIPLHQLIKTIEKEKGEIFDCKLNNEDYWQSRESRISSLRGINIAGKLAIEKYLTGSTEAYDECKIIYDLYWEKMQEPHSERIKLLSSIVEKLEGDNYGVEIYNHITDARKDIIFQMIEGNMKPKLTKFLRENNLEDLPDKVRVVDKYADIKRLDRVIYR